VVLEIGAGLGAMTIPVSRRAQKVFAVEKDPLIIPILESELGKSNAETVEVIHRNILDVDLHQIAAAAQRQIVVLGNLPYNISSQILVWLIQNRKSIARCVLMFQRELVRRLIAAPGGKDYGRLSVMLQYCARVQKIAEVKASLFFPQPKVDSDVVDIKFKPALEFRADDEAFLFKVIKAAFSKRRKMMKNSLGMSGLILNANLMGEVFARAKIDPSRRAETLSVEEFVRLSNILFERFEESIRPWT
jgi:16S rRNA (adenine1518-N6/adenine1519-N6)-dimethyltransferase